MSSRACASHFPILALAYLGSIPIATPLYLAYFVPTCLFFWLPRPRERLIITLQRSVKSEWSIKQTQVCGALRHYHITSSLQRFRKRKERCMCWTFLWLSFMYYYYYYLRRMKVNCQSWTIRLLLWRGSCSIMETIRGNVPLENHWSNIKQTRYRGWVLQKTDNMQWCRIYVIHQVM